jgi:hypothetical protein
MLTLFYNLEHYCFYMNGTRSFNRLVAFLQESRSQYYWIPFMISTVYPGFHG